jgi:hypothetical protein
VHPIDYSTSFRHETKAAAVPVQSRRQKNGIQVIIDQDFRNVAEMLVSKNYHISKNCTASEILNVKKHQREYRRQK